MILPWVFICASLIVFFKYWEWELRHACVGWHYISGPHSQSFFLFSFFFSFYLENRVSLINAPGAVEGFCSPGSH